MVPAVPPATRVSSFDVIFGCEGALWEECQHKTGSAPPAPFETLTAYK